jgi:hypothetical protein
LSLTLHKHPKDELDMEKVITGHDRNPFSNRYPTTVPALPYDVKAGPDEHTPGTPPRLTSDAVLEMVREKRQKLKQKKEAERKRWASMPVD